MHFPCNNDKIIRYALCERKNMKIYQVGGCVRDRLLGQNPKDIDYVVVGSSPEEMLSLGYEQVGAAFPVFLHPETKDEYALARKEIKTGAGYLAFETETKNVSLEEDLYRRDLTINAIAMDSDGTIIDPYNGAKDLQEGVLRHVSSHFNEDPVRLLRIARFAARYNFSVAQDTNELLMSIVDNGEIDSLQAERVWLELEKTITESNVQRFFQVLTDCNACEKIFPFKEFPHPERFTTSNTPRDNLLIIFSEMNKKELDKWTIPSHEKEMIGAYKHFFEKGQAYTDMQPEDKILFIRVVKAMHKDAQDPEIIKNIFTHIQRFKNPEIDVNAQLKMIEEDVQNLRNHPFETLVKEYKKEFPKGNIGEFTKQEFIKVVSRQSPTTKHKLV